MTNKYLEKIAEQLEAEPLEKEAGNADKILARIKKRSFGEKSKVLNPNLTASENAKALKTHMTLSQNKAKMSGSPRAASISASKLHLNEIMH